MPPETALFFAPFILVAIVALPFSWGEFKKAAHTHPVYRRPISGYEKIFWIGGGLFLLGIGICVLYVFLSSDHGISSLGLILMMVGIVLQQISAFLQRRRRST